MNSQIVPSSLALFAFITLLTVAPPARAGWGCPRFFSALPQVEALSIESGQVRFKRSVEVLGKQANCSEEVPEITLTEKELVDLRPELKESIESRHMPAEIEQLPSSCTRVGPLVYFGLSFYRGEGTTGAGGIGRLDLHTRKVDVRRPKPLRTFSVRELLVIDQSTWFTTEDVTEGTRGPGIGIARYDWAQDRLETFQGTNDGPCGMWANDVLLHDGELWVATELGISRYSLERAKWRHFVPLDAESQDLRETTCHAIYQEVASRLSGATEDRDIACDLDGDTPRGVLRALLEEHRPQEAASIRWNGSD